jgi:hypothetical protein
MFQTTLDFIRNTLTGWTILIFAIIIIYFVTLRKYYVQKEQFYDHTVYKKNSTEKRLNNMKKIEKKEANIRKKYKNASDTIEGFYADETPSTTQLTNIPSSSTSIQETQYIATTIFDNLDLSTQQLEACKLFYNQTIAKYISELGKLYNQSSKNEYLNVQKQFDMILANGIDNIINYLANTIKTPNRLTRTSIRTEVMNTLTNTIENLLAATNTNLTRDLNTLNTLESGSSEYQITLGKIKTAREDIDKYVGIDRILSNYGHNVNLSSKQVNSVLDKSYILPMYERSFDKINQLVKSDFNDNENNLANKYGKAYTDFLEQQKREELNINPLELASTIEGGLINMISNLAGGSTKSPIKTVPKAESQVEYNNWDTSNGELREQYTREYGFTKANNTVSSVGVNPIPSQQSNLVRDTALNATNVYSDVGNLGNYLIDKKTQKNILEGFANGTDVKNDMISSIMNGDFLQYVMEFINNKLLNLFSFYNMYMGEKGNNNGVSSDGKFNFSLEENMIPAGFALFVLSMLIYFVDVTS